MPQTTRHDDSQQPAGWYPDPAHEAPWRWWDGTQWTAQTKGRAADSTSPSRGNVGGASVASLRGWWARRGWWKWPAAGFAALMIIGAIGNAVDPVEQPGHLAERHEASRPKPAVKHAPPIVVTRSMINRRGGFWTKQPQTAKLTLVRYCLGYAKTHADLVDGAATFVSRVDRAAVARRIDAFYADKHEHFLGGTNADEQITSPCNDAAETLSERLADRHQKALEASVKPRNFRATAARVRRLYKVNLEDDDLRTVSCSRRTTCTVALNATVGNLGVVGDVVFGAYSRDYEAQLDFPITDLFHHLFGDPKFQGGSITAWLEVRTRGGKTVKVPALTVSCDRSADKAIDWDGVGPDGLRHYCGYNLRPIQGIS